MTIIGSDSVSVLARVIYEKRIEPGFADHLDELLIWLNKGGTESELTSRLDLHGIPSKTALQRALALIDQYLFGVHYPPHRILGVSPETPDEAIRLRYRRLIQAFHPDRQLNEQEWLTERTERLNAAYRAIKNKETEPAAARKPAQPQKQQTTHQKAHSAAASASAEVAAESILAYKLRAVLGAGRTFEQRFFAILFFVCLTFLGYLYYINNLSNRSHSLPTKASTYQTAAVSKPVDSPVVGGGTDLENSNTVSLNATGNTLIMATLANNLSNLDSSPSPPVDETLVQVQKISLQTDLGLDRLNVEPLMPSKLAELSLTEALPRILMDQRTLDGFHEPEMIQPSLQESLPEALQSAQLSQESMPAEIKQHNAQKSLPEVLKTATDSSHNTPITAPAAQKIEPTYQRETELAQQSDNKQASAKKQTEPSKPEIKRNAQRKPETELAMVKPITPIKAAPEPAGLAVCGDFLPFLAQFSASYNRGDANAYASLFGQSGTDNQLQGRSRIRQTYLNWFKQTEQRRLQLRNLAGRPISSTRCLVKGRYTVSYKNSSGNHAAQNGRIEFLLEKNQKRYKIISVRY